MERIKADDLYAYRFLSEVAVAPDGAHAAFVSRRARDDGKGYYACIHLLDTATGAVRPLTGNGDEASFRWLDANTLIFPSCRTGDQPGKTAFYRLDIRGSEAERAFTIPLSVKQFHPLPDGRWFVLTRRPMTPPEDLPADQPQPGRDYTVFDELPFWADGLGMINGTRMSGWIFDPADGSVNQITPPTYDMEGAAVSPEGSRILYWGVSFEGIRPDYRQLMLYDLATGQTRSLVPDRKYRITQVGWWGTDIWFEGGDPHTSVSRSPKLYLLNPATGDCRTFCAPDGFLGTSAIGDMSLGGGKVCAVQGDSLYAVRLQRDVTALLRFDKAGNFAPVASYEGIACFDIIGENAYLAAFRDHRPQELYRQPLSGGEPERLTQFHDAFLETRQISRPEHITFRSRDGQEVDGWVIRPSGYEPGKKYPGVLNIHGGPKAAYGSQYYHEMQLLAAGGRFVFYTNPHGSDGRGQDYFDLVGRWGTIDYQDLMDFTDEVLRRYPDVDADRLGVCGGSYGGYMTNWIIGHTQRFKAACAMRSISNFVTSISTCDKGYLFLLEHMGLNALERKGVIWDESQILWDKSPLKYVRNVTTPTLFIHSNTDYRCWMDEPLQMFTSLRQQGVPSKVVLIHQEGHELNRSGRPVNRLIRLNALCDWFDQYL